MATLSNYIENLFDKIHDSKCIISANKLVNGKIVYAKQISRIRSSKVVICPIGNKIRFQKELVGNVIFWRDIASRENMIVTTLFQKYFEKLLSFDSEHIINNSYVLQEEKISEILYSDITIVDSITEMDTCRILIHASDSNYNRLINNITKFKESLITNPKNISIPNFNLDIESSDVIEHVHEVDGTEDKKWRALFELVERSSRNEGNSKTDTIAQQPVQVPVQEESKLKLDKNLVRVLEGKKKIDYDKIDIKDSDSILYFAQNIQSEMFKEIDVINFNVLKFKDQWDLKVYLAEVTDELKEKAKIKTPNIIQKIFFPSCREEGGKRYIEKKIEGFKQLIEGLESTLTSKMEFFDKNGEALENYKSNLLQNKNKFEKYLLKGEKYLKEEAMKIVKEIEDLANANPNDVIKSNELFEIKSNLKRLEQKMHDLKITSLTSDQLLTTLTILINSYTDIKSKLMSVLNTTIPLFKVSSFIQISSEAINDTAKFINDMEKGSAMAYESSMLSLEDSIKYYNEVTENKIDNLVEAFREINNVLINLKDLKSVNKENVIDLDKSEIINKEEEKTC